MKPLGLYWAPTGVGPAQTFALRAVTKFEGVRIEVKEGAGVDGDPVRTCIYWFDGDGLLIARYDALDSIDAARGVNDGQSA